MWRNPHPGKQRGQTGAAERLGRLGLVEYYAPIRVPHFGQCFSTSCTNRRESSELRFRGCSRACRKAFQVSCSTSAKKVSVSPANRAQSYKHAAKSPPKRRQILMYGDPDLSSCERKSSDPNPRAFGIGLEPRQARDEAARVREHLRCRSLAGCGCAPALTSTMWPFDP